MPLVVTPGMRTSLRASLITAAALALIGCGDPKVTDLDDGGTANPTPTPPAGEGASIGMSVTSASVEMNLADLQPVQFTVTGFNGFTGNVQITASNLPAGVTATPETVMISAPDAPVSGMIELSSTSTDAVPGDYADIVITATPVDRTDVDAATGTFDTTILAELAISTRNDVSTNAVADLWGANATGANQGIVIHMGAATSVTVSFTNMSTTAHLIHGNGTAGMDHGQVGSAEGDPGATQTRVLTPASLPMTIDFYCHTHGNETTQPGRVTLVP